MMQLKFLLFSAVCCGLLQAILCDPPASALFRPRFSTKSSFTSSPTSSSEIQQKIQSNSNTSPPKVEQEVTSEVSTKDDLPDENDPAAEENPTGEAVQKKTSSKKKLFKAASRKNSISKDPLDIEDTAELKERSKKLLVNLLENENANKAITFMARNAKHLLENQVTSNIIATHTNLIKDTLSSEEAKEIIKDIRVDIYKTFVDPETPEKITMVLDKSKQCLSRDHLPALLTKRFKILKKIIKNKKTYPAMVSVKKAFVKFLKNSDIKLKIAKGFKLLDFGIHFDPNNVIKSLTGFSFFK